MTATTGRESLANFAAERGWQRKAHQRADIYLRGIYQVHAIWRDADMLNAGSQYEDSILLSYTRDLAKVQGWLAK